MPNDGPIRRILDEIEGVADEETLAAVEEELESRLGHDSAALAELDELLADYRDELQAVHDEFEQLLADAGFDDVVDLGPSEEPTTPEDGDGLGDLGEHGGTTGPLDDASGAGTDPFDALDRLADLHERGAITDEEFESKKAELLEQL
jgi:uncharacterized coiled-coil protein SlyX